MSVSSGGDAQVSKALLDPESQQRVALSRAQLVQRWRDLRHMLIQQLDQFENGGLTLRANHADISSSAIADLKQSILEFEALISADIDEE